MKKLLILLFICFLSASGYPAWDNDKPADNRVWDLAAGDIRDNNDALEAVLGVDLQGGFSRINVKSTVYGALGDGSTDDITAINAAIQAASAGDSVWFPAGTYIISTSIIPKSGVSLKSDYATIKLKNASNTDMVTFNGVFSNLTIEGIIFDGNQTNQTYNNDMNGINFTAACLNVWIRNCKFINITGRCIETNPASNVDNIHIVDNKFIDYLYQGVNLQATSNAFISNNIFDNESVTATDTPYGVSCNVVTNVTINDNIIILSGTGSGNGFGITVRDGINTKIDNNTIDGQDYVNIGGISCDTNIRTSDYTITNNTIFECEGTGGIEVGGDTDFGTERATINNNTLESCHKSGIILNGGIVDNVTINGNILRDCGTGSGSIATNTASGSTQTNITMANNVITDSAGIGIRINGQLADSSITGNVITNSTNAGLELVSTGTDPIDNLNITGNVVIDGSGKGLNMSGSNFTNIVVVGNNFSGNATPSTTKVSDTETEQNLFANNIGMGFVIPTLADTDATPSVGQGNVFLTSGTTTITDFDDGFEGQEITIIAEHTVTITDGTNIFTPTGGDLTMNATDILYLIQKADGKWYTISFSDNT